MNRCLISASLGGLIALSLFSATPMCAADYHFLMFGVGGGFTTQTGRTSNNFDNGGHLQAAAGINLGILGLGATFMYYGMGLTGSSLAALNEPDGHANIYSLTVEPKIRVPFLPVGVYVLGGGGWMRRMVVFTKPVLAQTFATSVTRLRSHFRLEGPLSVSALCLTSRSVYRPLKLSGGQNISALWEQFVNQR